jgi:hypothetical protein
MFRVRCLRNLGCATVLFGIFCGRVSALPLLPDMNVTRSISGQFIVTGDRQVSSFLGVTNSDFVRLEPALLAVSAERIKQTLWGKLGINSATPWRGQIFLALHPARSLDEDVTIISERFADGWDYHVVLPDVLTRSRFLRAMTGVVLLEFANRGAGVRSAEIPAWLTDGLSQQLLEPGMVEVILSSPARAVDGLLESRMVATQRGVDSLASARDVLRDHSALTFEQLSWPTGPQLSGADGGVYRASAQLFVNELLKLKNGPAHLRAMLQMLPRYYNWQTAFQGAFRADFSRPLDVEKWWALQVVSFIAHSPGQTWTPAVSREKLNQILSVPVDFRAVSNALPAHAEVSLQAVIRNFDSARQTAILQTKLRDLELAQFRMARSLAVLTAEYRAALAGYLGQSSAPAPHLGRLSSSASQKVGARATLKKLDALDARRRTIESAIKPDVWRP